MAISWLSTIFVRGCALCLELGGRICKSIFGGRGGKIVEIWYWKGRGGGEGS